jgi:hypothetical protein
LRGFIDFGDNETLHKFVSIVRIVVIGQLDLSTPQATAVEAEAL